MFAIKNDKREANQGLQNIQGRASRDISQRFSTIHLCHKELHQRRRVGPRSASVKIKNIDTPNVHSRGRTNQTKCELDDHTMPWRYMNIQFTVNPVCPEAAIRKCSENKYFKKL